MAKFQVYKDSSSLFRWRFLANNGETIAVSSESYTTKQNCLNGLNVVKSYSGTAQVEDLTQTAASSYSR